MSAQYNPINGIDFNRMSKKIADSFKKDFDEDTNWEDVIDYQAKKITEAIFDELTKMTFYVEPGQIQVLTNGSPTTQTGTNINMLQIKLK